MKKFMKWFGTGLLILVAAFLILLAIDSLLPEGWKMTSEVFVFLSGAILSVVWNFVPSLRVQFAALSSNIKSLVNLILMIILAVVMFIFTCTGFSPVAGIVCSVAGAKALAVLIFMAIVGNQITYVASPQPDDVVDAKLNRYISG